MYTRVTNFQCKPDKLEEATALAESLKPEIMAIPGITYYMSAGNDDGDCISVAVYESRDAADAAADTASALFARFDEYLEGPPQPQSYRVLLHGTNL